ncbi:MAG TPA: FAD-binding oxidoreductase [Streptosporangiaceae bacterium]|nr:FAD-binding oxidoreductase [Streptosporangiaceae bacterium]
MFSPADVLMAGEVLTPGQDGYEEAAAAVFAVGTPDLIVRPRDASSVAVAVRYAVGAGLPVSVRSGGHSPAGHSTSDGGVVIDLRHLREVRVLDPGTRRVRVGAGATWGAVAATLQRSGLALTSGDTTSVGVGGLTLAGGIGWMVRRYGLAIDAVTGADLVTADGRLVRADAAGHQDLLWALRGGGGNFGVVTSLDFTAQPVASVHFGPVIYRLDAQGGRSEKDETNGLACLITGWHDLMGAADENLTTALALVPTGTGRPAMAVLRCCYAGADQAAATAALAPFRRLAPVAADEIRAVPYAAVLEEATMPPGTRAELRNAFFRSLDHDRAGAIAGLFRAGATVELRSLGGAFGRVPADATAFAHRDAQVLLVAAAMPPEVAGRALAGWPAVAARTSGAYTGFLGPAADADADAGVAAAYPPATYQRLARVKQRYDPGNVFRRNHNIRPAGFARASALPHVLNPASQTGVLSGLN